MKTVRRQSKNLASNFIIIFGYASVYVGLTI